MIKTHKRRLVFALLVICVGLSATVLGAPTFSDKDIAKEDLNPTDVVIVQEITVTGDSSQDVNLTSAKIQNLDTAGTGDIDRVDILDGGDPLGFTTNIVGLAAGVTVNLGGHTIPKGATRTLKVQVTVGTNVTDGATVRMRVRFYYKMGIFTYTSSWITDLTGETIRDGGFDQIADNAPTAGAFNPGNKGEVQIAVFTDKDANGNNVFWGIQTGSQKVVAVENLGTATTNDIDKVEVTLKIDGTDYSTGEQTWNPGSSMNFNHGDFAPAMPVSIPDNHAVTVTVEMRLKGAANITDWNTIQTKTTLFVREGGPGNEQPYEQSVTAGAAQTIRKQGFETIVENSTPPPSGTASSEKSVEQVIEVADDDVNGDKVDALAVEITNLGTADGTEIHQIQVKTGATILRTITAPNALLDDFKTGMRIDFTAARQVDDDDKLPLTIYYEPGTVDEGHTLKPEVRVFANEPPAGADEYATSKVTYPAEITLYQPGFETVENVTPPDGGTAYSGQRLLAQTIRVVDKDENEDNVTIHPVVVKNRGDARENPDVVKIEVMRRDSETDDTPVLMGETTTLTGLRTSGVTVPTQQNNIVTDSPGGTTAYIDIYVTIAEPEEIVTGRTLQLETRVLHTETARGYDKEATGNLWTLEINHRPVVDFTSAVQTAGTQAFSNKAIRPMQFTYQDTIQFTSTVTDQDGAIDEPFTYLWNFGDGTTSTEPNPTHRYPNGGTFNVTLTVTDARGVSGTVTKTITVEGPPAAPPAGNDPPVAAFTVNKTTSSVGEALQFTDQSTDPDGTVTKRAWNFGDGGTSAAQNPTHAFMAAGAFTVSLIVTDNDNADSVQSASTTITVQAPTDVVVYGYPNPASTQATFFYNLPAGTTSPVLRIFDLVGRLVRRVELPVAQTTYVWNLTADVGGAVANGLYFCVVTAQNAAGAAIKSQIFKLLIDR